MENTSQYIEHGGYSDGTLSFMLPLSKSSSMNTIKPKDQERLTHAFQARERVRHRDADRVR